MRHLISISLHLALRFEVNFCIPRQIVRKMVEALSDEACIESKSMFQRQVSQF